VRAALDVIEGAGRAAQFLTDATRKRAGAWWRDGFTPPLRDHQRSRSREA
jgi:RNA polymerase sigma-70 factor (ECF subfamily)